VIRNNSRRQLENKESLWEDEVRRQEIKLIREVGGANFKDRNGNGVVHKEDLKNKKKHLREEGE